MNLNDNKNEFEIIDNGSMAYQPRYPLAQAPGSELQQMNYKDWMNRCEMLQAPSGRSIILTSLSILGTILGNIPIVGGILGSGISILKDVMELLWPEEPGEPGAVDNSVWIQFMERVEELIEEKINQEAFNQAMGRLSGLRRALNLYRVSFELWNQDKNDLELQEDVRIRFTTALSQMVYTIETLRYRGQEVNLLTAFTQAADLHLLLLREGIMYGLQWGMDERTVQSLYTNSENEGLKDLLPLYTDYCTKWYAKGLEISWNLKPNLSDIERYPWMENVTTPWRLQVVEELEGWNLYNDFRRDVTIMALDLVAIWPTYDLMYYDNLKYGVKTEITRPVYSRAVGSTWGALLPKEAYEQGIVRPPHLVTWLDQFNFYRGYGPFPNPSDRQKTWAGIRLSYNYAGDYYTTYETPIIGSSGSGSGGPNNVSVEGKYNKNIYQVDMKHNDAVYTFDFFKNNGAKQTVGTLYEPYYPSLSWPPETDISNYSSQMTWICGPVASGQYIQAFAPEWTHVSCTFSNVISEKTDVITQIPAVKSNKLNTGASVIRGNGSTGGDLISLPPNASFEILLDGQIQRAYQLRLRYICEGTGAISIDRQINSATDFTNSFPVNKTGSTGYNSFGYVTMPEPLPKANTIFWKMSFRNSGNIPIIIDKLEFIPMEGSVEEFEANQAVEKARKAVNALFTNDAKDALQLNVTDYAVDQAANLAECVSEDFHAQEKMILLDQVKFAKRLSQARNLLNYGDFESSDWSGENGWRTSLHVHVASDNPIFKGRYLHMPGVMSPQFSNNSYPTYAYQKVDESKLKSYTRYLVRGFVGNSKDLELLVERYGKDVHVEMDVPNDIQYSLPMNECGGFDRCKPASYQTTTPHTCTCKDTAVAHTGCQCKDKGNRTSTNRYTNVPIDGDMYKNGFHAHKSCGCGDKHMNKNGTHPHKSCGCKDPHVFTYHIDTGCVDMEENLGLFFALKIASENGFANIDNIEIIEAHPLTGEALARVKKREQRWKQERDKKRLETEKAVQAAQTAIQKLFTNAQQNRLKFETLFPQIVEAEMLVQQIPYVYHDYFLGAIPSVPGRNDEIYRQLSASIENARALYEQRNLVNNGTFVSGTGGWHVAEGVEVQRLQNTSVLVLSEWSHEASQQLRIDPDRGYVLRVTARKEGGGKGMVTMSDCAAYTETLTFTSCDSNTSGFQTMTSGTVAGFVTKTLEIFPDTDRIRIDIGETEGVFKVESVELICMEQMEDHI